MLRYARGKAALSQRELAKRAGVPQPTVARIESGSVVPRVDTLDRLLRACGMSLEVMPRIGEGVDETLPAEALNLSPAQRANYAAQTSNEISRIARIARVVGR
jgi:transcriptional regulator with XRE-family HTH domain